MNTLATLHNPYDGLPRERRRQLTAALLRQASQVDGPEHDELLDRVVLVNMGVATTIASRYRARGIAQEDLEQVANAALVRAVHHFDQGREGDLLSYAVPSIRGEIRRYFRDQGWTVRPPRRIQELQSRVFEARERLAAVMTPSPADIAESLDVPVADVEEALTAEGCFTPASLDVTVGERQETSVGDLLPDPRTEGQVDGAETRVMLQPLVRDLPARDRRLLRLRFFEELTQQEIADDLGVTQTQVSRLLSRVLGDLREGLGEVSSDTAGQSQKS